MTFEELIPYHGKAVSVQATNGRTYKGKAVVDIEELDLMLYLEDCIADLYPEQIKSIEVANEA